MQETVLVKESHTAEGHIFLSKLYTRAILCQQYIYIMIIKYTHNKTMQNQNVPLFFVGTMFSAYFKENVEKMVSKVEIGSSVCMSPCL
jgi:hypothetical protein